MKLPGNNAARPQRMHIVEQAPKRRSNSGRISRSPREFQVKQRSF
jgi:hypothetical protein